MFLGEDLLQWLLLALGGALFVVTAAVGWAKDRKQIGS